MDSIEAVAEKLKAWAAEKGVLSYDPPEDLGDYHGETISDLTNANDPAVATEILLHKKINFIGVDPEAGKVIVCTHRKVSGRDLAPLPKEASGGFDIEYIKAFPPQVRLPAMGAVPAGTHGLHAGRYTCGSSISVGNCVAAGTLGCLVRFPASREGSSSRMCTS